ncbi:MAG: type 2 isopentenyl-diphosphate Delta-isomerase [Candidatus Heimdallarchaeota archaeon]|nr:type 2 isopentenyl-diphosphate Delta-isomerase [Candidatus Heimdallarchaeota archaeon]
MKETDSSVTSFRKDEHILLCLENDVQYSGITNGFDDIEIEPSLLTQFSLEEIDLATTFLSKEVKYPIIVSGMTGGSKNGRVFNESVARICSEFKIGMGVGSQRAALEDPKLVNTYEVRHIAPNIPLIANLGIAQFIQGYNHVQAQKAITMIGADALAIHINPLQEFVQGEGDKDQTKALEKIVALKQEFEYPIIIKGVGTGLTKVDAKSLSQLEVYALDVAGAGGTNWSRIEFYRNEDVKYLSDKFLNWGISTKNSLMNVVDFSEGKETKIIASGGVWSGFDAVKALLLGADYVALALPILRSIGKGGIDECRKFLSTYILEMKAVMAMLNVKNLEELKKERHKILDNI